MLLTQLHIHKWLKVPSQNLHSFPATAIGDSCLASSKGSWLNIRGCTLGSPSWLQSERFYQKPNACILSLKLWRYLPASQRHVQHHWPGRHTQFLQMDHNLYYKFQTDSQHKLTWGNPRHLFSHHPNIGVCDPLPSWKWSTGWLLQWSKAKNQSASCVSGRCEFHQYLGQLLYLQ